VGPRKLSTEPHIPDHDEAVCSIGSDPQNTGDLGKGQEADHIFSEATAVVIPEGIWHCPMVALKF
jgi:hypothetical protein